MNSIQIMPIDLLGPMYVFDVTYYTYTLRDAHSQKL